MHLADDFMQNNLHCIHALEISYSSHDNEKGNYFNSNYLTKYLKLI